MAQTARAFWVREPGVGEIRSVELPPAGDDEVLVRTVRSGVSRGTETLVFRGAVSSDRAREVRAPFQEGGLPGPVKYGYLTVGTVEAGPPGLLGRTVFCLHPHQTAFVAPTSAVVVVPDGVPPSRAVLAGTANLIAAIVFLFIADIAWLPAVLIAIGATAGGLFGAGVGRRLSDPWLRAIIVVVGLAAIAQLVI